MRVVALMVCSIVMCASAVAVAQNEPTPSGRGAGSTNGQDGDEVIVTGKRLGELKADVEKARERAWGIFNDINSSNDFDVHCAYETRVFSHTKQRVCRPQFESRIAGAAAKEYMGALYMVCPADPSGFINFQACMTGAYSQRGQARTQGASGEATVKGDQFRDEIFKLAGENDQFAQAILDFYAAQQKYEAALKPTRKPKGEAD